MTVVDAAEAGSIALYAAPLVTFLAVRSTRGTHLLSAGLDVPLFVATDLLSVILLACLLPLEIAILVSRPAWIAGLLVWARRSRPRARPAALAVPVRGRVLWPVAISLVLAVWLSASISRRYFIWDRYWHAPQITAIATQRVPFVNVYEPTAKWRYHYAADVFAEMFRTLSFDVISANRALAVEHDAAFGLTAATVAFLVLGAGERSAAMAALGGLLLLLQGPIPLHGNLAAPLYGVMYSNFLCVSFRPHVALSALLLTGFVGALASGAFRRPGVRREAVVARLAILAAVLSLTDETSLFLLDVGVGFTWLAAPDLFAKGYVRSGAAVAAVGASSILPSYFLGGSLSPGGPVQKLTWVAAHVPSYDRGRGVLPWSSAQAKQGLFYDFLPLLVGAAAIALVLVRRPSRALLGLLVFAGSVVSAAALFATHVEVNHQAVVEVQRFFVAPFFAVLVVGLLLLPSASVSSVAGLLVVVGMVAQAAAAFYWRLTVVPGLTSESEGRDVYYELDCRREAAAGLGDRPKPTYVAEADYYVYTGCRAVFSPGGPDAPWPEKIYPHSQAMQQLRELDADLVPRGSDLDAVCRAAADAPQDPVCARLLQQRTSCRPDGHRYLRCALTPHDRDALLGRRGGGQ